MRFTVAGARRVASRVRRVVLLRSAILVVALLALIGGPAAAGAGRPTVSLVASTPCHFQKAARPVRVAFCDSFDHGFAQVNGSREGASGLDPQVWGASRIIAGGGSHFATGNNPSQGTDDNFAPVATTAGACGGTQNMVPDRDVRVCGGTLFDSVNDDGGQTVLAMYPKQPFDIAGRTGTVSFNVSDNTQGIHGAWPSFVYTDQPVPAPYSEASGLQPSARNSFGITFAQHCDQASNQSCTTAAPGSQADCPNTNDVTVDSMFETQNYALSPVPFTTTGCVAQASQAGRQNHVEITISTSTVKVYMSNPGSSSLVEVAEADNAGVPLTKGLVWMEDNHYNADKFNAQQSNTFAWSDLGFDGPIEARDVGYDVPESGSLKGEAERLGWNTGPGRASPVTVTAPGVSSQALSRALGALIVFNWFPVDPSVPNVSVNGKPFVATPWPFSSSSTGRYGGRNDDTYVWRTMAVQVPLREIRAGDNAITFENAPYGLANVSLILQGAGGVPDCLDPSNCVAATGSAPSTAPPTTPKPPRPASTPTPAPSRSPAPTPTPEHITNVPCTATINGRRERGTCSGDFTAA